MTSAGLRFPTSSARRPWGAGDWGPPAVDAVAGGMEERAGDAIDEHKHEHTSATGGAVGREEAHRAQAVLGGESRKRWRSWLEDYPRGYRYSAGHVQQGAAHFADRSGQDKAATREGIVGNLAIERKHHPHEHDRAHRHNRRQANQKLTSRRSHVLLRAATLLSAEGFRLTPLSPRYSSAGTGWAEFHLWIDHWKTSWRSRSFSNTAFEPGDGISPVIRHCRRAPQTGRRRVQSAP